MALTKIESYLEGVEERHEEAECKLVEVREGAREAVRILYEVQEALEETHCMIECIREGIKSEVHDGHNAEEEIARVLRRLFEAEWMHEELEDGHVVLSAMYGDEGDSDESEGDDVDDAFSL